MCQKYFEEQGDDWARGERLIESNYLTKDKGSFPFKKKEGLEMAMTS